MTRYLLPTSILPALILSAQLLATAGTTWYYGIDVWTLVSESTYECIYKAGYETAFIRIYTPTSGGRTDSNGKDNVLNALQAKLGVEVFVQPAPPPLSTKSGAKQFDEAYKYMSDNKITLGSIWLLVTQPNTWSLTAQDNIDFINSFLDRARQNNLYVGIYTNWYDWALITGDYDNIEANGAVMLWFWNVLGVGPDAETTQGYADYRGFGSWTNADPTVKQFGIIESVCGATVNRDVYKGSSSSSTASVKEQNRKLALAMRAAATNHTALSAKGGLNLMVGGAHFEHSPRGGGRLRGQRLKTATTTIGSKNGTEAVVRQVEGKVKLYGY